MAKNKDIVMVFDHDKMTKNNKRFSVTQEIRDALKNDSFGSIYLPAGFGEERVYVTVSTKEPASLKDVDLP